jgi:sortase A
MRDKRPVDELSIEELERVLAIKKREARQQRLQKMGRDGRLIQNQASEPAYVEPTPAPAPAQVTVPALEALIASMNPPAEPAHAIVSSAAAVPDTTPRFDDRDEQPPEVVKVYAVPSKRKTRMKRILDRVLLLVEVAAVIGIVVIGVSLFDAIRSLERETASAQALADEQRRLGIPTIAPTPSLRMEDYVLPSGHIFTADGGAQFNYNEVPEHLRPLVQSQWVQPVVSRPATTSETAVTLTVPALNLSQTIVQGVDWEALKQGVGQLPNSVNPGDLTGNVVLAAHNDIYGQIFRHLDQLKAGDQFQIATRSEIYTYTVSEILIVEPDDVWVMEDRGKATATLISCYPYQVNNQRIVVMADRVV